MKIKRCELYAHVKSFEGKSSMEGFLGFIDTPVRDLRVIRMPEDRIRLKYIDCEDNIHRIDVGPDDQEVIDFPLYKPKCD